jgi:hypothetical protein
MSLSPFDSFQSRFVTYLLNCPRTIKCNIIKCLRGELIHTKILHSHIEKWTSNTGVGQGRHQQIDSNLNTVHLAVQHINISKDLSIKYNYCIY